MREMADRALRIVFMGTPDFAAVSLQCLLSGPDSVVGVVSQPDRPQGRGKKVIPTPVKALAEKMAIPVFQPTKIKTDDFFQTLLGLRPDLLVVVAYGRILPPAILNLPALGCINVHGSLLPSHRGAAPIQWSIIKGDKEVGVTIMQMDEGMDTGDILLQRSLSPDENETSGSLFNKIADLGGQTLMEALPLIKRNLLQPQKQESRLATHAPMLKKEDGRIDWAKTARQIHCHIRGVDPWPTAYSYLGGRRLQFFSPEIVYKEGGGQPGTVIRADKQGILVSTGSNCLLIREIQAEGKKRQPVESFLCGHPITAGSRFVDAAS